MSNKLKITLGVLLLIAGFLLTRIGLTIKKSAETASRVRGESTVVPEENPFLKDVDNDGIADYNEAYYETDVYKSDTDNDGYLDGEEIVSLTSPIDPDDNPKSVGNKNVTQTLTNRLLGGIYTGDLLPQEGHNQSYDKNVDILAVAGLDEAVQLIAPTLSDSVLIIGENSKEAQEQYLKDTATILDGQFLTAFMAQTSKLSEAANLLVTGQNERAFESFRQHANYFTSAYTRLLAVSAPPKWLPFHRQLLITFQKIAKDFIYLTKIYEDPIVAAVALSDLGTNFSLINFSLIEELKKMIAQEQLQLPDSPLFGTLGLLENIQN